jgi:hypothetical protein
LQQVLHGCYQQTHSSRAHNHNHIVILSFFLSLAARGEEARQRSLTQAIHIRLGATFTRMSHMRNAPDDTAGPTPERIQHAGQFFTVAGRSKSSRRITMLDDALGRAWMRRNISGEEYSALKKYALHWLAGGLQGHLGSVDLNRILAFDPGSMSGLAKTEAQADHRAAYWSAHDMLGHRPAFVADQVACYDSSIASVGRMLGFKSPWRGRERAIEILADAGYRLAKIFEDAAKRN